MVTLSRSQRVVAALKELEQFKAIKSAGPAICALTGVRVETVADPLTIDHGKILLTFPGATPFEVAGEPYLEVQMIESVRLERASSNLDSGASLRLHELREVLRHKHGL